MYYPDRDGFVQAAQTANLIPVYRELCADGDTPVSAYAALGAGDYSFLLESVVGGATWAAYSFVGVAPRAVLVCQGGEARVTWFDVDGGGAARTAAWPAPDPAAALAEVMGELRPAPAPGLPRFWGGAVGWIAYDCVRAFEELPARPKPGIDVPTLCMAITDTVVIFDNLRQTMKIVATPYVARPERAEAAYARACARIDAIVRTLRGPRPAMKPMAPLPPDAPLPTARSAFGQAGFEDAVGRIKDYVAAGDAFQVVLSQRLDVARGDVDPFDVYRSLRVVNPSPYMFHLRFPEATVTGASPETLVRLDAGVVSLRPIAGTRRRGATRDDDAALAAELAADPKERAEHLMLIDLGRNDVGRVARTGTVRVTEQFAIERYSHVMHLVSQVEGELAPGKTWRDVLAAAFPAGTLSGAPKIRAMEIIDELEPTRRGLYGGAVGYVSYTGNLDLAIAIRTLVTIGDTIHVQAGAGVVADSTPTGEWDETQNKARAVLRAVAMAAQPAESA
ncbi:MAG: chorismate-binding protein [Kofleriaceae bacterium]|jgi:anthranilate synthase component 1|nr:chorismate-binding protein [Kofleriaceae bacterium]MBP9169118.1 chorismate-binding protein [Kofleriaceae bacterium]MBP9857811.1 chorismate-binding protein [Kofleriaceae bacterium]